MPGDGIQTRIDGLDEARRALEAVPDKLRKKGLAKALREAGKVVQGEARSRVPVLKIATPWRKPGTVKRRIAVRASKTAKRTGDVGVFINVRPIRGRAQTKRYGKAGARNPNDPYYWRFLEFGTRKMAARPFLRPALDASHSQAVQAFVRSVKPAIEKLDKGTR